MHPGWKYVYWFTVLGIYCLLMETLRYFNTAFGDLTILAILCVTGAATAIEEMLPWQTQSIVRTAEKKWKCLACDTTTRSWRELQNRAHRFMYTCQDNDAMKGCGKRVYQCHSDKEKHSQVKRCKPCDVHYRGCSEEHENCRSA